MFGLTMVFSMEIFSKLFGSYLQNGGIAWLDYAKSLMLILAGIFGQAIGVASFPYLARLAAEKRWDEMNRMFNTLLRYLATLVIPTSILMYVLRNEIVRLAFERMDFEPRDTEMTAIALSGLLVGAVAIAAMSVVNRGFYAMQNTIVPTIYGTVAVVVSLPVYWLGLKMYGLVGVALAISISAIIQASVVFAVWNRRSHNTESRHVYLSYIKTAIAGLPLGAVLWLSHRYLVHMIDPAPFGGSILIAAGVSGVFFVLMAMGGWIFKVEGIRFIGNRIIHRVRPLINR
jgi:putative peptidoglycan lipid II flippase